MSQCRTVKDPVWHDQSTGRWAEGRESGSSPGPNGNWTGQKCSDLIKIKLMLIVSFGCFFFFFSKNRHQNNCLNNKCRKYLYSIWLTGLWWLVYDVWTEPRVRLPLMFNTELLALWAEAACFYLGNFSNALDSQYFLVFASSQIGVRWYLQQKITLNEHARGNCGRP